ncbi:hypothetical protein JDFR1000234_21 [uncultured archaeal virus]|uniref:Uncharacterized protein n=1 Tax=uncultured archaeal virus TaxID=1960247 RepID=A0A1S5Y310_9VIRU|nr:hypothetical protein JDFR1000234_21 [uncultured archaeal virus]
MSISIGYENKGKWRSYGKSRRHVKAAGWDGRIYLTVWHLWNIWRWKKRKGLSQDGN